MLEPETAWRRVGDAVKALADEEDIVRHALALRARVIEPGGNEDDVDLSASLAALVVRELDALSGAAPDEPASVVVRFVLPRGWHSDGVGGRPSSPGQVATREDALQLHRDGVAFGCAFVDSDGHRVDPTRVVVAADGMPATEDGATVYRPKVYRDLAWVTRSAARGSS